MQLKCLNCDNTVSKEGFKFCKACRVQLNREDRCRIACEVNNRECLSCREFKKYYSFASHLSTVCKKCTLPERRKRIKEMKEEKIEVSDLVGIDCLEGLKVAGNIGEKAIAYSWYYIKEMNYS